MIKSNKNTKKLSAVARNSGTILFIIMEYIILMTLNSAVQSVLL